MKPRVFVGTMFSGENEYELSSRMITDQVGVYVCHHIVSWLRERDAHEALYSEWNNVKNDFDFFVQVDPDTVLNDRQVLVNAWRRLCTEVNQGFTSLQYPLHDFLTDRPIMGLNVYSRFVEFVPPRDEIYCDRATKNNVTKLCQEIVGQHSPDPSLRQAFHFGLHRGLKNKWEQRDRIAFVNATKPDDRRFMALEGFLASQNFVTNKKTSYTDIEFNASFDNAIKKLTEK